MSAPFMQLYVADYLGDTQHLTAEQHGAYLLLLMTMWRQGGSLPNDPRILARIARVSARRWHLIAPEVMAFFDEEAGYITQKRLVEEYQKAVSKSEKRSVSGKAGGEAKALKDKKSRLANAKRSPKHLSEPESEEEEAKASPSRARDDEQAAFDLFNEKAHRNGLPVAEKLTKERRAKLKARLSEAGGIEGWGRAMDRLEASDFCAGRRTDFRASIDFVLQPSSFTKLIEGTYDNNPNQRGSHERRNSHAPAQHAFASALDRAADRRELRSAPEPDREGRVWPSDRIQDRDGPDRSREGGWSSGGSVHPLRLEDRRYG